jgi:hypothetical protein
MRQWYHAPIGETVTDFTVVRRLIGSLLFSGEGGTNWPSSTVTITQQFGCDRSKRTCDGQRETDVLDPKETSRATNYCVARGSLALAAGHLTQATFA